MSRLVVGVGGGIAAYKTCSLVRRFGEAGDTVTVVPTANALKFVGAPTWEALSGQPVMTSVFESVSNVPHISIGQSADLVVVTPATADLLARAATGRADDLLTNVLLTARCPVLFVPAMHTEMWQHPATQANVALLRSRGAIVLDPADGRLTGADSGPGRMPEPDEIFVVAKSLLSEAVVSAVRARDLVGRRVLVSAGGTREALDPVRYLGNHSSGKMGVALARAAALRGASVTLVGANIKVPVPSGCAFIPVESTAELGDAMLAQSRDADLVVMAAAPADFTPAVASATKIKKSDSDGLTLELAQTMDVLAALVLARATRVGLKQSWVSFPGDELAGAKPAPVIVGFAAETASGPDLIDLGRAKLQRKGCDLLVCNDVTTGVFGADENVVTILAASGVVATASGSKDLVAHAIIDAALIDAPRAVKE